MQKLKIYLFFLILCAFPCVVRAQVTVADLKGAAQQAKLFNDELNKTVEAVYALKESALGLIDVGAYLDLLLSFDFSIPKPEMSSDVVNAVPKTSGSASGVTGQIKQATDSVSGGISGTSGSDNQKFGSKSAVEQSVTQNMQVRTEESAEDKDVVSQAISMATGSNGSIDRKSVV